MELANHLSISCQINCREAWRLLLSPCVSRRTLKIASQLIESANAVNGVFCLLINCILQCSREITAVEINLKFARFLVFLGKHRRYDITYI